MAIQHSSRRAKLRKGCGLFGFTMGVLVAPVHAQEFTGSGFASIVVGRSFGACTPSILAPQYTDGCTRYVADWAHAGVYENGWSFKPETRMGYQGTLKFNPQWSATAQVTARTAGDKHAALEWLYVTYKISNEWSLQVGRKRLPLYYYSDFQDIGYAYNTIRPSPDVYGWDVVNYNGISLSNTTAIGDWSLRSEALYGAEKIKDSTSQKLFNPAPKTVRWKNIVNANAELSKDWFTARVSYTRFQTQQNDLQTGNLEVYGGRTHELLGVALNADIDNWIFRSEAGSAKRESSFVNGRFGLANLGYRFGDLTVTGGVSAYHDDSGKYRTFTGGLRYEVHKGAAVKLQVDRQRDASPGGPALGDSRVVSASYDVTF